MPEIIQRPGEGSSEHGSRSQFNRKQAVLFAKTLSAAALVAFAEFCFQNFLSLRGLMNVALSRIFLCGIWTTLFVSVWILTTTRRRRLLLRILLGTLLAASLVVLDYIAPRPADNPPQFATKADIQSLKDAIQRAMESNPSPDSQEDGIPGLSLLMVTRITSISPERRNYLFDVGRPDRSSFSCYLDKGNIFASLTDNSRETTVLASAPLGDGIPIGTPFFLTAAYGQNGKETIVEIFVNTKRVAVSRVPRPINLGGLAWHEWDGSAVLGADLNLSNNATFDSFGFLGYTHILSSEEIHKILLAWTPRLMEPVYFHFGGQQWARLNRDDNNMTVSSAAGWRHF